MYQFITDLFYQDTKTIDKIENTIETLKNLPDSSSSNSGDNSPNKKSINSGYSYRC